MRLLVVDDHPVFLGALQAILEEYFETLEFTGVETVAEAEAFTGTMDNFNLVIVDLSFRGKDVTRQICSFIEGNPTTKFLVLTNFEDGRHIRALAEAGARGYLPKSTPAEILISVVQLVAAGGQYFPHEALGEGITDPVSGQAGKSGASPILTMRQGRILEQLAAGASIADLAGNLHVSEPTIKADIAKAIRALDARNRLHAVCLAIDLGLIHPDLD